MTDRQRPSPETYLQSILDHVGRHQESHLHSGANYYDFYRFLSSDLHLRSGNATTSWPTQTQPATDAQPTPNAPFPFVTVIQSENGTVAPATEYCDPKEFDQKLQIKPSSINVLFLRGFPSPEWLRVLGARFLVEPEYFRRHLDFLATKDYHDQPCLPSASFKSFSLRDTTMFTRSETLTKETVRSSRNESEKSVRTHHIKLSAHGNLGESIVRKFSQHNESVFTIEQRISCYITKLDKALIGVVLIWLDAGQSLGQPHEKDSSDPWLSSLAGRHVCLPIIQHHPKSAMRLQSNQSSSNPRALQSPRHTTFIQSSTHLAKDYGSLVPINLSVIHKKPIAVLHDVFKYSLSAECQFMNFVDKQIEQSLRISERDEESSLENLRFHKNLLDDRIAYIHDTIFSLEHAAASSFYLKDGVHTNDNMSTVSQSGPETTAAASITDLPSIIKDFQFLLDRAQRLSQRCLDGTTTITNTAALRESREGIEQAKQVKNLTLLAFIFIPASFVSSVFGMNFLDLGAKTGYPAGFGSIGLVAALSVSYILRLRSAERKQSLESQIEMD